MVTKEVTPEDVFHLAKWAVGSLYYKYTYRTCRKCGIDFDDVVQDVCTYYYDKVHGRRAQGTAIGTIISNVTRWRLMRLNLIAERGKFKVKSNLLENAVLYKQCPKASDGQDSVDAQDFWDKLSDLIPEERDREIIEMVLGYEHSNVDCGKAFGLSRERIRQVRDKWTAILRGDGEVLNEIKECSNAGAK